MKNETCWLLEHLYLSKNGRPRYFDYSLPDGGYKLTRNPMNALRFPTRKDARGAIKQIGCGKEIRATEHIFTEDHHGDESYHSRAPSWYQRALTLINRISRMLRRDA